MKLDYWLAIWTGLAAILVLDTLFIRNARLAGRRRRFPWRWDDFFLGVCAVAIFGTIIGIGIAGIVDVFTDWEKQEWGTIYRTLHTFPEKP